jgi:ribosomal protein S18 acetylase RimI-like enzyme
MSSYSLRQMTKNDLVETFLMRNDSEVCKYAQSTNPISWSEHEAVFLYTDYPKYVFVRKVCDVPRLEETIGYVEFRNDMVNDDQNTKIWGFHLDSEWRGKGLSKTMLEQAIKEAKKLGVKKIIGYVKSTNEASKHLHKSIGFDIVKADNDEIMYEFVVA